MAPEVLFRSQPHGNYKLFFNGLYLSVGAGDQGRPVVGYAAVKPWELLGRTATPEGDELTLMRRSGELVIFANGKPLMSSRMHGSEEALATLACRPGADPRLPLGAGRGPRHGLHVARHARRAAACATVVVAELLPAVVEWNRGVLGAAGG